MPYVCRASEPNPIAVGTLSHREIPWILKVLVSKLLHGEQILEVLTPTSVVFGSFGMVQGCIIRQLDRFFSSSPSLLMGFFACCQQSASLLLERSVWETDQEP